MACGITQVKIWLILFLCLIPVPSNAWQVGDLIDSSGSTFEVTQVGSVSTRNQSYSEVILFGVIPCESFIDVKSSVKFRVYELGQDVGGSCDYQRTTLTVIPYVAPPVPPVIPSVLGSSFGVFTLPAVEVLSPANEYTAIFNYFFSIFFWFTMLTMPIKWTLRFFR